MRIVSNWNTYALRTSNIMVLAIVLFFFSNCSHNDKRTEKTFIGRQSIEPVSLDLDVFSYLEEVIGCSCYLSSDSIQFRNQEFIYAEKYGLPDSTGFAFIKLDGDLIRLKVTNYENDTENSFRNVRLSNDNLEVLLSLTKSNSLEPEVVLVSGTIQLFKDNQPVLIKKIIGTCGC